MSLCGNGSLANIRAASSTTPCGCDCDLSDLTTTQAYDCIGAGAGVSLETILSLIDEDICSLQGSTAPTGLSWCAPNGSAPAANANLQTIFDFVSDELIPRSGNDCDCAITDFLYFGDGKGIGHCANGNATSNKVYFLGDNTYVDAVDQIRMLNDLKVDTGGFGATQLPVYATTDLSAKTPEQLALTYTISPTANMTLTLPEIADSNGFNEHRVLIIANEGCGSGFTATIEGYGSDTIAGDANRVLPEGESWILHADGVSDWVLVSKKFSECSGVTSFTEGYVPFGDAYGWLEEDTTNHFFYDKANGFLGIGTASPAQQLHITKNFRFPASTTTTGIFYQDTNRFMHTYSAGGANNNLFLGKSAGNLTSTGGLGSNIGIGSNAVAALTSGEFNIGIGTNNLQFVTSGSYNTAVGVQTLRYCTTGSSNTGMGDGCMYGSGLTLTGSGNTAMGRNALYDLSSGASNVAIGYEAGVNNTTGSNNIIIGYQAGYTQSTSQGNIFIGYQAGYSETGSGKLYIDNSNTTTPLIGGDFSSNRVSVNMAVSSQHSTFDVDGSRAYTTQEISSDDTLTEADYFTAVDTSGGDVTVNLPAASVCGGRVYVVKKIAAGNTMTIDAAGADLIDGTGTKAYTNIYQSVTLISDGVSNWWII